MFGLNSFVGILKLTQLSWAKTSPYQHSLMVGCLSLRNVGKKVTGKKVTEKKSQIWVGKKSQEKKSQKRINLFLNF